MKQESADEFLDWELSDLELIPVFSIAVPPEADQPRAESEGHLCVMDCQDTIIGQMRKFILRLLFVNSSKTGRKEDNSRNLKKSFG